MTDQTIPEHYRLLNRFSTFSDLTGPFYEKVINERHAGLGVRVKATHLNKVGVAHGGLIMTVADNAFGDAILNAHDEPVAFVTMSLTCEFMSPVREGDWLEATVDIQRKGKRVIFANCDLRVGDKKVAFATALFSMIDKK
ncbi:PaaI family thioesterase [Advenella mimigardefordensis]|uniref:Putative thioesterase n=1 Tax=Advenella mimigardefordensis (strain DSM 17166 / LMG 22922 / DPN7) TaxID=1247726 RepID=W0PE54_ADVMD|nr:PaaI family thioesterase [Advenella mimigardefordensis]AHG63298.1 putative thioesterase [Advenella mimigardefordensis DPN7]